MNRQDIQVISEAGEVEPVTVEILTCPKCGAPVESEQSIQDGSRRCSFCNTVYTLRQGQDNSRQLKRELQEWLDQLLVTSGGVGGVDLHTRRLIFHESLYPALKKDIDRKLEHFENSMEAPLVVLEEMATLQEYQADARMIALSRGDNHWLQLLMVRIAALQAFVVEPGDKEKLQQQHLRVRYLLHQANIVRYLATPSPKAYRSIQENLIVLRDLYREGLQESIDEAYCSYLQVLEGRVSANIALLELLTALCTQEVVIAPEELVRRCDELLKQFGKVYRLARESTYNPLYTVPLVQGIQKDSICVYLLQTIVSSYEMITRTREVLFWPFYQQVISYALQLGRARSAADLLWLLTSIGRIIQARCGDAPLPVLANWDWVEEVIARERRAGTITRHYSVEDRYLHPYWVARVHYSEVRGLVHKRAYSSEGFIVVDASVGEAPVVFALNRKHKDNSILRTVEQNVRPLDSATVALPAVLTREAAEQVMREYTRGNGRMLSIKMIGVMYLPAAVVRYKARNGAHTRIISRLPGVNQQRTVVQQARRLLQQYEMK